MSHRLGADASSMQRRRTPILLALWMALAPSVAAGAFANFESTAVHPIRVSSDGATLYAVHTPGSALAVYDLTDPADPVLTELIPVGLEPVSVTARTSTEVWVANLLSDSVTVVDTQIGAVVDVLRVVDEPSDIAFAGGKAFVTAAVGDEVYVFDATSRSLLSVIPIFGKEPRALAVSGDDGTVYVLVHRSGNGTTILHHDQAPPPPPPVNPALPAAPQTGLIVRADDPAWASEIPYTVPDQDVHAIDVASETVVDAFVAVGTVNFDILVHPTTDELLISNTDARNLVRFETALRGHTIDNRITTVVPGETPEVEPNDLNPDVDYGLLPNPGAMATALADPRGLALDPGLDLLYVAAQGTDRVGVFDLATRTVIDRIEISGTTGALVDTRAKRGPRGLALHPSGQWLYVWNRLADTITVVNTQTRAVAAEIPVGSYDPVPSVVREGRKFLFDAKLSGNGTNSCASCHVDADGDHVSWDLGNPEGELAPVPPEIQFDNPPYPDFHPMKGPMFTQTLRGLAGVGPLHWRGDREDFVAFNGAFDSLMGGAPLDPADMALFAAWSDTVLYPPNPNQLLDRSFRTTPANANELQGFLAFTDTNVGPGPGCAQCHVLPTGTNGLVRKLPIGETQQMKIAQMRNLYRKNDLNRAASTPQKVGFGLEHDGSSGRFGSLPALVFAGLFVQGRSEDAGHVVAFLESWDTGTAPALGYSTLLDATTAGGQDVDADLSLLELRAQSGDLDLVARGVVAGEPRAYLYLPSEGLYAPDSPALPALTRQELVAAASSGARLLFLGAYPGTGAEIVAAADEPSIILARTTKLRLKDDGAPPLDPGKRSFTFKSSRSGAEPSGVLEPHFGSSGDPSLSGAHLTIYRVGGAPTDKVELELPAERWRRTGSASKRGYKYKDSKREEGPIKKVALKKGKLTIAGKGDGLYALAGAPQGEIALRLRLGTGLEICMSAMARVPAANFDTPASFLAAPSARPATCPPAPSS